MLQSRAIGNFLLPTYQVMIIMSLSHLKALLSERIKCSIPLVDKHINIRAALDQLSDDSGISVKYILFHCL